MLHSWRGRAPKLGLNWRRIGTAHGDEPTLDPGALLLTLSAPPGCSCLLLVCAVRPLTWSPLCPAAGRCTPLDQRHSMASWEFTELHFGFGHLQGPEPRIVRPPPLSRLFIPPGLKLLLRPSRPPFICPPCLAWPLVSIPGLKLALRASPASLPRSFLHAYTHAATHLLAQRPTSASPVTSPQQHAPSFNLPYRGRRLPRPAGLLSAVPAALPPLLAAGARPQAGLYFRPRAGAHCLQHCWLARSSILRWVFRGLLPPHASMDPDW